MNFFLLALLFAFAIASTNHAVEDAVNYYDDDESSHGGIISKLTADGYKLLSFDQGTFITLLVSADQIDELSSGSRTPTTAQVDSYRRAILHALGRGSFHPSHDNNLKLKSVGADIYSKYGHYGMVTVCESLPIRHQRTVEMIWSGIATWQA